MLKGDTGGGGEKGGENRERENRYRGEEETREFALYTMVSSYHNKYDTSKISFHHYCCTATCTLCSKTLYSSTCKYCTVHAED